MATMKREERFEFTYINANGEAKTKTVRSKEQLDKCLKTCEDMHFTVVRKCKLYPFSTMRNQHNFELIANTCANAMYDMQHGITEWDDAEYDRLAERRDKAQEFFCYDLPVAWVPWDTYCEMKELAVAAECHRDTMNARARYERDSDWRPGDAPWNAPGMSARDFVR